MQMGSLRPGTCGDARACPLSRHLGWLMDTSPPLLTRAHPGGFERKGGNQEGRREDGRRREGRGEGYLRSSKDPPHLPSLHSMRPRPPATYLIVAVGVVGDSKDGDNVVFAKQAHQCGHRRVILCPVLSVGACGVQVAPLVIAIQDAGQHVSTVSLVVESRLSGEHQQVGAVRAPADVTLGTVRSGCLLSRLLLTTFTAVSCGQRKWVPTWGSARPQGEQHATIMNDARNRQHMSDDSENRKPVMGNGKWMQLCAHGGHHARSEPSDCPHKV